jgi:hypothetical protein
MKTIMKVIALCACIALLIYGIYSEKHAMKSFMSDDVEDVDGLDFTKGATIDRFIIHEGELYDGHGLAPEPVKECPT